MTQRNYAHDDASSGFDALIREATADPDVVGLILTGSMTAGIASPWSDYDVRLILRDDADSTIFERYAAAYFPYVDLGVMTLSDFADYAAWDSPFAWDRYTFAHAQVLLDRTGTVRALVAEKGRLPPEHQESFTAEMLDAFINGVYRALKCQRKGNVLCVRLEAAEAVQYGLHVIFAFEGRLKPYPVWLAHDLRVAPLASVPIAGDDLLQLLGAIVNDGETTALQRLLAVVLEQARERGYGEVIDSWGEDIDWMLTFSREASPAS